MKNITILSLVLFALTKSYSQDYLIDFVGEGLSTTIDSVIVENLTQNKSITVPGGNQLRLNAEYTGTETIIDNMNNMLHIYPNPTKEYCTIKFDAINNGIAKIEISDLSGKIIAQMQSMLEQGKQFFIIGGLYRGIYIISVKLENTIYKGKIISYSGSNGNIQFTHKYKSWDSKDINIKNVKSTNAETIMQYNFGDRLKFTGVSGDNSNVFVDIPIESKTVTFTFISCIDGDNNNYPTVTIGTQTWMAENLKTTKYNDGKDIPLITENVYWGTAKAAGYCWYNNDEQTYKSPYGALYNWYVIYTNKICPSGWFVPSDEDWDTLVNYLGGEGFAGGKLKETGTAHWISPNTNSTNKTGFTALPGGRRGSPGAFEEITELGYWWSSTEYMTKEAWYRYMIANALWMTKGRIGMTLGFSVRCLKY